MSVRIRLAQTAEDLDAVFRLRHRVFAEQEGYFTRRRDGRVVDCFDAFPTTGIVLAEVDGRAVGTYRLTEYTSVGTSTDEWFDFRRHLPSGERCGSASLLAVDKEYRDVPGLVFSMLAMLYAWAVGRGLTTLSGVVNPVFIDFATRHGWRPVGPQGFSPGHGLPFVPVVLTLTDLPARFVRFLDKHDRAQIFDRFERGFYQRGERLFSAGDLADSAFVIVDGEVSVALSDGQEVTSLGAGHLVGELALINERPRSATVVASTEVTVMVVDRASFLDAIENEPQTAKALMRILAQRIAGMLERQPDASGP